MTAHSYRPLRSSEVGTAANTLRPPSVLTPTRIGWRSEGKIPTGRGGDDAGVDRGNPFRSSPCGLVRDTSTSLRVHGGPRGSRDGLILTRNATKSIRGLVPLQSLLLRMLPLPAPGRALAEVEWRTLSCVAEALAPDTVEMPSKDIADNVETFLIRGRSRWAWRVRALMHLIEWSPLIVGEKPFSEMSLPERRRLVAQYYVDGHGLWGLCAKARYLILIGVYGDGRLHAPTSYVRVSRRRRFERTALNGGGAVAS